MLEFDDSAPTHLEFAIPALKSRGIPGTFYINPGNGPYLSHREAWEREAGSPGIELANHTFSHIGGATIDEFEREITQANAVIDRLYPDRPRDRLRSWARPGVPDKQWGIGEASIQKILARHRMIERPAFFGPPFSIKTIPEMLEWIDGALAAGELRHLVFHGVCGDWHPVSMPYFLALLDKLEAHASELWLTNPLAAHKYETQRDNTRVQVSPGLPDSLRLCLASPLNSLLYDQPLTLATQVPARWKHVAITQGRLRHERAPIDGEVIHDAIPGAGDIVLAAV